MGLTLIKSLTAAGDSELEFIDGTDDVVMDNTYNEYQFYFVNMHPASSSDFSFQVNASGGADFDETITSTFIRTWHRETGDTTGFDYGTGDDQAQGIAYQNIYDRVFGEAADSSVSGILTLYDPSSTTYVKHFVSVLNAMHSTDYTMENLAAGYINTTSAIDEISFKFSGGNIDDGTIYMYGVS